MDTLSYKTVSANKATVNKGWLLVDANEVVLGRLASQVAMFLRGKHKTNFTPHSDCGDNVIVINAEKVKLTGNKWEDKKYIHHTGYPGGQRIATAKESLNRKSTGLVEKAVKGMLPKNRIGKAIFKNLRVYEGNVHPHQAQLPKEIKIEEII